VKVINNVNNIIASDVIGKDVRDQRKLDKLMIELDGTPNKAKLGANAIVGVSLAIAKAAACSLGIPLYKYIGVNAHILPVPAFYIIGGGMLATSDLDFQEFHVIPVGAESFSEAVRMSMEVYHELAKVLDGKWGKQSLAGLGFGGGYYPLGMKDPRDAFDAELLAIKKLGYEDKFVLGLDCAASHFYNRKTGRYTLMGKEITREELMGFYKELVSSYPLESIEDPGETAV